MLHNAAPINDKAISIAQRRLKAKALAENRLNSDGDDSTPIWQKALKIVNGRRTTQGRRPYKPKAKQLFCAAVKYLAYQQAATECDQLLRLVAYLNVLPSDPYEAVIFEVNLSNIVRCGKNHD